MKKPVNGNVYKFIHYQDEKIKTNLLDRSFKGEWLEINPDGEIILKASNYKGYAWDGCSPKFNFIDIIWGTPDGRFDNITKKQITYYASMFHDVLYQHKSEISLSRKEVDIILQLLLSKSGFSLASLYYFFVRLFGGTFGKWKTKTTLAKEKIQITYYSWYEHDIIY